MYLFSSMVAHSTFYVPCFLCQAHAFRLCSCSEYIWSLWNSNHKNTRKPLNWVPINYIFRNKAHGLACGMPWLPMGCCAPASAQTSQGTDPAEPLLRGIPPNIPISCSSSRWEDTWTITLEKRKKTGGGDGQLKLSKSSLKWLSSYCQSEISLRF